MRLSINNIKNYQDRGLCYLLKAKAEADTTNRGLDNSCYYAITEFNNKTTIQNKTTVKTQRMKFYNVNNVSILK